MGWVKNEVDRIRKSKDPETYSPGTVLDKSELKLLEFWDKLVATIRSDISELEQAVPDTRLQVTATGESLIISRPTDVVAFLLEVQLDRRQLLIRYFGIGSDNVGHFQFEAGEPYLVRGPKLVPISPENAARELLHPIVGLLAEIS